MSLTKGGKTMEQKKRSVWRVLLLHARELWQVLVSVPAHPYALLYHPQSRQRYLDDLIDLDDEAVQRATSTALRRVFEGDECALPRSFAELTEKFVSDKGF